MVRRASFSLPIPFPILPITPKIPKIPILSVPKPPPLRRESASNVKFALKFKIFSRNIWLVRKNRLPLHSLFGGNPTEKHPGQRRGGHPPKIFSKKNWWIQKLAVTLQTLSGSKSPGAEENIERLTIDKSSTRAR